jgi:tRNA threonylcarbamoyladenosine biosynthesis protein TsaB
VTILAIDSALAACSAAILRPDAARIEPMERGHAERLAPMVESMMAEADVAFASLSRVVVTIGPGSFTGLRVGLSFARTLARALEIPCIGVSTLRALAGEGGCVRAGAIAAPGGVYLAVYANGEVVHAPTRLDLAEALALLPAGAVVRGNGAALLERGDLIIEPALYADPLMLARIGAALDPAAHPPTPDYLREPDAKLPT